jgi:(4S)-4-hydroxy-5-phosphonooxypentane-2,3-dione isomerase
VLIVLVSVHVLESGLAAFKEATVKNARASLEEPGIARFDVIQRTDDPTRFVLIEVYRNADAPAAHKQTAHYLEWRDAVAALMASPRTSQQFENVAPDEAGWAAPRAAATR